MMPASALLGSIPACAWTPPGTDDMDLDANYQQALPVLRESAVWKKNAHSKLAEFATCMVKPSIL